MQTTFRVTLRDIAKKLNVSHATVSLALRNSERISQRRKDQVRALATQLGYEPDPMLSSLVAYRHKLPTSKHRGVIAWISRSREATSATGAERVACTCSAAAREEEELYFKGAFEVAARVGFRLEKFIWREEFTASRMHQILYTRNIQGLMVPSQAMGGDLAEFPWEDFSVVRLGASAPHPTAHIVSCDHMQSAYMATGKIYSKGYRRIGFVTSAGFMPQVKSNFIVGHETALSTLSGASYIPHLQLPPEPGAALFPLQQWLSHHKPDAILTTEATLPQMLKSLGIRTPGEIAIASTNVLSTPGIDAGMKVNFEEAGRIGAEMITSVLVSGDLSQTPIARQILVASEWHDGATMPPK